jgi:hypothetical protein
MTRVSRYRWKPMSQGAGERRRRHEKAPQSTADRVCELLGT